MPVTETGARFRIKVSENTNSNCKDAALSSAYTDVYDGQGNVFSSVAGQSLTAGGVIQGAVAFGNSAFPVEYITEFPMPDPPKFGEATLDGLELNLYFSDINQTNDYTPLNLEIYKLKEPLQTEGNFLPLKNQTKGGSDIYFASSIMDGMMSISEDWSGAGDAGNIDLGAFTSSSGYMFLSLDDAWDNLGRMAKFDYRYSKDNFFAIVGSTFKGEDIIKIKPDGENWKSSSRAPGWGHPRPKFKDDDVKNLIQSSGQHIDASHQDNTKLDITDTILEHLDYTEDYFTTTTDEDKNYSAYSRPYIKSASSPSNGVVFSMGHFTSETESFLDPDRTYSLRSGPNKRREDDGPYQEIRTWFSIPSPQRLETNWNENSNDSQTINERTGVQVELVINIDRMNSRQKKIRPATNDITRMDSNKWQCTGEDKMNRNTHNPYHYQKYASMARSFIITLTDRPPEAHEKFHNFVFNMKKPWPDERNIGDDHVDGELIRHQRIHGKNPKLRKRDGEPPDAADSKMARFYGIAFWNDGTSTVGKLRAVTSSYADGLRGNYQHFGAAVRNDVPIGTAQSKNRYTGNMGFPIFEDTIDTKDDDEDRYDYGFVPKQQLELGGTDHTAGIGLGQWFKVVMSYTSSDKVFLTISLLDMNDNVINSAIMPGWVKHHNTGTVDNFVGDSMPRYCTIWCLHEGIDGNSKKASVSEPEDYNAIGVSTEDADYTADDDTYTEVLIDSIKIRGFETSVNNITMGLKNTGGSSPRLEIQPDQKLWTQLIQANRDPVFTLQDDGSTLLTANENIVGSPPKTGSIWTNLIGSEEESFNGVVPNYLSFGFKDETALQSTNTHLFLGGYSCDNLPLSDGTDANKRPATINAWLGDEADVGRILENKNSAQAITTNGTKLVDYFTRKGFLSITGETPSWTKRENSLVATKITDISRAGEGRIAVADLDKLLASEDEQYIIFRVTDVNSSWANRAKVSRAGLLVNDFKLDDKTIIFNNHKGKLHLADDGTSPLCVEEFLDELYISPYRYWLLVELWNIGADGTTLPNKTYSHVLSQHATDSPTDGDRVLGMTYNEFLFSDSPKLSNQWNFSGKPELMIFENTVDYGYGTFEEKETGYLNSPIPITIPDTHTLVDISNLVDVESDRLLEANSLVSLYVKTDANGTAKLHTNKVTTAANRPFLNVIYKDLLPELTDFVVQPNEEDPFYPTYTWASASDDLWYGFLIQDDKAIEHQYHSAVAHIPLNETGTATYLHRYTNEDAFGGSRVTATDVDKTTSIEGLAGNCLVFDGTTTRHTRFADNTYDQPSGEMSVVAHFVASTVDDTHYIVSKYTQFALYVDSSGYIHAKVHYDASNSVNLKSISLVPTDGATPVNAIVTLDVGIPTGNVKLFINGKLEDQSGVKTTDGSVSNWKIDATLPDPAKKLDIGMADTNGSNNMDHPFEGKIEEIVIYNKAIYPVVPQTGELSLFKPITELTTAPIASGKSIVSKLFVKDYHNIRGTTTNQVTSSSMVAYRKSGVGLKTN